MNFCANFKDLRKESGYTAQALASILGYSKNIIYEWEKGRAEPNYKTLCAIANVFDVSVDYLIGNTDDVNASASAPVKSAPGLSKREEELLKAFDCLDVYQQDFFFNQITATARENTLIKK